MFFQVFQATVIPGILKDKDAAQLLGREIFPGIKRFNLAIILQWLAPSASLTSYKICRRDSG